MDYVYNDNVLFATNAENFEYVYMYGRGAIYYGTLQLKSPRTHRGSP
jgi:hypothetical protein